MMLLERDPPVDARALLRDLVGWGWKLKRIADAINVPRSTLGSWWYVGATPKLNDGLALMKLHDQESRCRDSVPTRV